MGAHPSCGTGLADPIAELSLHGELRSWHLDGLGVPELLDEPKVLKAARALAVGQLRKGSTVFGPFHNDSLADAIFVRIQEELEAEE